MKEFRGAGFPLCSTFADNTLRALIVMLMQCYGPQCVVDKVFFRQSNAATAVAFNCIGPFGGPMQHGSLVYIVST